MKNKQAISIFVLIGFLIVYAVASIVFLFIHFTIDSVMNIIVTIMGAGVICAILYFSAKMSWGKVLKKHGHKEEAEIYDKVAKEFKEQYYNKESLTFEEESKSIEKKLDETLTTVKNNKTHKKRKAKNKFFLQHQKFFLLDLQYCSYSVVPEVE